MSGNHPGRSPAVNAEVILRRFTGGLIATAKEQQAQKWEEEMESVHRNGFFLLSSGLPVGLVT
jgi:hypothetical protein